MDVVYGLILVAQVRCARDSLQIDLEYYLL
jgi:hypothetical protein